MCTQILLCNDRNKWSLNSQIFKELEKIFVMQIDLFASRLNAKCKRYVSWQRDPSAEYVDAFSTSWSGNFSTFPPFSLVGCCLQKVCQDQATAVVIFPLWPTQSWFSKLLGLLTEDPIILPGIDNILILPGSQRLHPLCEKLKLIVAKVSGQSLENSQYQKRLSTSCYPPGSMEQTSSTAHTMQDGTSFVFKRRLIMCNRMSLKC